MAEEYRNSVYWGSGTEGRWYKEAIDAQVKSDMRFRGSLMHFVRYAVFYCLTHDETLKKVKKFQSPGA